MHAEGTAESPARDTGNAMILLLPRNWTRIRGDMALAWEARSRQACFANFPSIRPLLQVSDSRESFREVTEGSSRRTYFCPDGGSYSLEGGRVACSVHGSPDSPGQPEEPRACSRLAQLLDRCQEIRVVFSFTEHGVATRVSITMGGRPRQD